MPIYEYSCSNCSHVFEEWQKDFVDRECECPECGAASKRLISNTAFILKGSGWYVTDYADGKKNNGDQKEPDKAAAKANGDQKAEKDNGAAAKNNGGSKQETKSAESGQSSSKAGDGAAESKPKAQTQ